MRSFLIKCAVVVVTLCGPIFLGGLGWGFYLISTVAPLWLFMLICFSGLVVALGFASLLDRVNPLPPPLPRDR